ncbi:MAG: chromate efflux transporter [Cyanobacteria bacterium P01_E01_bin.34]
MTKELAIDTSPPESQAPARSTNSASLPFLFLSFLKVGSTAFGGFMALISVVESIIVERRKLLQHEDMLDGISLASVLPGPVAANVVAYVGYRLKGSMGAIATATGVLLPSFILVLAFTIVYQNVGNIPEVTRVLMGFVPAVAAIILGAVWRMSKKALKGRVEVVVAIVATAVMFAIQFLLKSPFSGFASTVRPYIPLFLVIVSGVFGWAYFHKPTETSSESVAVASPPPVAQHSSKFKLALTVGLLAGLLSCYLYKLQNPAFLGEDSLATLFTTFSGMSIMLFGGGFVFIPIIQGVVVDSLGWVNNEQFTTAIAIGQITPGPILISAAFIGYVVKGFLGSLVSTIAIFFPPALIMVTCSHWLEQIKQSAVIQAALRGIRPAVIGMIFFAVYAVLTTAQLHWATPVIFAGALIALVRFKVGLVVLIPVSGILGLALYSL